MKRLAVLCLALSIAGCASVGTVGSREVAQISTTQETLTAKIEDADVFFASIFTNDLRKSQFETQVEYSERLSWVQPPASTVFFQVDSNLVEYVFNAEEQTLVVMLPSEMEYSSLRLRHQSLFTIHQPSLRVKDEKKRLYEYVGPSRRACHLNALNFLELPLNTRWKKDSDSYRVGLGLAFTIPSAEAKTSVNSKAITLILGVTVGNLRTEGGYSTEDITFGADYALPVRVTHLKAFNPSTGHVLASWSKAPSVTTNMGTK